MSMFAAHKNTSRVLILWVNIREVYISTIRTMKRTCSDWVKVKCDAIDAAQKQADDPKREEAIRQKLAELRGIGI